jgi:hypothetical protein
MYACESRITVQKGSHATLFIGGDFQFHSSGFKEEIFQDFKKDFLSSPNPYFIGLGDYGDFLRPSLRNRVAEVLTQDPDARKELDDIVTQDVCRLAEKMSFLKNRCIGLHSGHHEWEYKNGTNSSQKICELLNAQYLGWAAYTVLRVLPPRTKVGNKSSTVSIKIFSTHGDGGSTFSSGDMANLEKKIAPYWISDLYLRGHSSKGELAPLELNDVTLKGTPRIIKKTRWIVNCPGMMAGYEMNKTGYVEYRNLPPASMGYAKCDIWFSSGIVNEIDGGMFTGVRLQPMIVSPHIYK